MLGRVVDRRGQTAVLAVSALVAAAALAVLAALPAGTPLAALVVPAVVLGLAVPPVGACVRTLLPELVEERSALQRTFALESAAEELTWVSGPPLVLLAGTLGSTGAALAGVGALLLAATLAFAREPARRSAAAPPPPPPPDPRRPSPSRAWPAALRH